MASNRYCNARAQLVQPQRSSRATGIRLPPATAGATSDAYLWIKRPGVSDGTCGEGDPQTGTFVNQNAIDLARNAGRVGGHRV